MDIHKLIDDLRSQGAKVSLIVELPADPPAPPPPTPPQTAVFRVTVDTANARFAKEYNNAGNPVMAIYPSDASAPGLRKQYHIGNTVMVYPTKVKADGGMYYYEIAEPTGIPVVLYLRAADGSISYK